MKNKNKNSKIKKLTTLIENENDYHDNKIKEPHELSKK